MKNTVIVDIDGVLANYRLGLLYWFRQSFPRFAQKANDHLQREDTWINAESMGVSYREYLEAIEMFRMSGGKRAIPLFDGARDLLTWCKYKNYEIVLLTSRPIDLCSNIYPDTVDWLRNNELPYDLLLWSKNKSEMVFRMRLMDKIVFAIDDEYGHILDYHKLGIPSCWIDLYKKSMEHSLSTSKMEDVKVYPSMRALVNSLKEEA